MTTPASIAAAFDSAWQHLVTAAGRTFNGVTRDEFRDTFFCGAFATAQLCVGDGKTARPEVVNAVTAEHRAYLASPKELPREGLIYQAYTQFTELVLADLPPPLQPLFQHFFYGGGTAFLSTLVAYRDLHGLLLELSAWNDAVPL